MQELRQLKTQVSELGVKGKHKGPGHVWGERRAELKGPGHLHPWVKLLRCLQVPVLCPLPLDSGFAMQPMCPDDWVLLLASAF